VRWILICSLFFIALPLHPQSASDWLERLSEAEKRGSREVTEVLKEMQSKVDFPDPKWKSLVSQALSEKKESDLKALKERLEFFSRWEKTPPTHVREIARDVLKSPVFREAREEELRENWLARALDRLAELMNSRRGIREPRVRELQPPETPRDPSLLFYVAWTLLGVTLLAGCITLWRHLRNQGMLPTKKKARTKKALLSPEEEHLTLDEWQELAKKFESEGRLREAYRCLYISLLMTLAQERLIRWEPWETNWEHLRKIEGSQAPKEVSYHTLTQLFDHVWYGQRSPSQEEWTFAKGQHQLLYDLLRRGS
jgi:hypothetical protein